MTVILTFRRRTKPKSYPAARLMSAGVKGEVILFPGIQRSYHGDAGTASASVLPEGHGTPHKEH